MPDNEARKNPAPTDAQLQAELEHLESQAARRESHLKGIKDRIAELKKLIGKEGK